MPLDALTAGAGQTDQRDARHAIGGLLAVQGPSALDVRTGVLAAPGSGALITGTSRTGPKMSVRIGVHVVVTSRGAANGPYLGPTLEAPLDVDVDLAPASGSRIDVVYVKQRDTTSGIPTPDAQPGPLYGVLTGTPSTGTPTKPNLAALVVGAEELGTVTVSSGATSTNGTGVTIANTARQTVARGARVPVRNQAERDAITALPGLEVYRLDTGQVQLCTAASPTVWSTTFDPTLPAPLVPVPLVTGLASDWGAPGQLAVGRDASGRVMFQGGFRADIAYLGAGGQIATLPVGMAPLTVPEVLTATNMRTGTAVYFYAFPDRRLTWETGTVAALDSIAFSGAGYWRNNS